MSPFEFVFALVSIVTSLALTHLITGVVAIIRHKERSRFFLPHAVWVWIALVLVIGNWGALWGARLNPDWPALRVFAWLTAMTALYAFSVLVIPDVQRDAPLDLRKFHEQEGRRYIIAHNVFAVISVLVVLLVMGLHRAPLHLLVPPPIALALGVAALLTRGRAQIAASLAVALLATTYMVVSISLLSA